MFKRDGVVLRQVNPRYREEFELLHSTGLYADLTRDRLLLEHRERSLGDALTPDAYKVLEPEQLQFVTYPYEWSFGQLRDAALLTLDVQKRALARGMSLKDASSYNVQLHSGRLRFIDTLSFERYEEGRPWVAYRQFCQHFLAPLALMSRTDVRLGQLMRVHIDGVPLDLTSRLLPWRTALSVGLGLHVHAHAKAQRKYASDNTASTPQRQVRFSRRSFDGLVASLESAVVGLQFPRGHFEWADYYEANNNYSVEGMAQKRELVAKLVAAQKPDTVWDLGANTGAFSRVAIEAGARLAIAWDIDSACVQANYDHVVAKHETRLVPLLLDLTNPSPGLGWANSERASLWARGPADLALALGLVHHLAISNNVPLDRIAAFFASVCRNLVLEWVPKEDSQVRKLLATREDVFDDYVQTGLEQAFGRYFTIDGIVPIGGTRRSLYLMRVR